MWFFYSLFFSVWSAYGTLLIKRLSKKVHYLSLLFIFEIFMLPFMFILVLLSGGIPTVTANFYLFMLASAVIDTIAFFSFFKAINESDISLIGLIASFGPVFTTIIAVYTLGEIPRPLGIFGIILIVVGAYLLNVSDIKNGIFSPFKSLFKNKGVWFFMLATLIWAITPIFQKSAIFETTPTVPLYASFWGLIFVTTFTGLFIAKRAIKDLGFVSSNIKIILFYAGGSSLAQLAAFTAFSLAYVGYTTAIFRTSALFIVIFGGVFLKEKRFGERLIGTIVMIIGTVLLVI